MEKVKTWFKQHKQAAVLFSSMFFVCYFVFISLLPLRGMAASLRQMYRNQKALIAEASVQSSRISEMENELVELRSRLENYDLQIPVQADIGQFLGQIASLMDEHKLTDQMIEPQQEILAGELNCIPVSMKCKGGLEQLRSFFQSLQTLHRAVRIEKFKLSNDSNLSGFVNMETEAIIYYRNNISRK